MNIRKYAVYILVMGVIVGGCTLENGLTPHTDSVVKKVAWEVRDALKNIPLASVEPTTISTTSISNKNIPLTMVKRVGGVELSFVVTLDLTDPQYPDPEAIDWENVRLTIFDHEAAQQLYPEVIAELEKSGYRVLADNNTQTINMVRAVGTIIVRSLKKDAYDSNGLALPGAVARFKYSIMHSSDNSLDDITSQQSWQYYSQENMGIILGDIEQTVQNLNELDLTALPGSNLPARWQLQYNGTTSSRAEIDISADGALLYRDLKVLVDGHIQQIIWSDTVFGEKQAHIALPLAHGSLTTLSIEGLPLETEEEGILKIAALRTETGQSYPYGLASTWHMLKGDMPFDSIPLIVVTTPVSDIDTLRMNARTMVEYLNSVYAKSGKKFRLANLIRFSPEDFLKIIREHHLYADYLSPNLSYLLKMVDNSFPDYFWEDRDSMFPFEGKIPPITVFFIDRDTFKITAKGDDGLHVAGYADGLQTVGYDGKLVHKPFVVISPLHTEHHPLLFPQYVGLVSHEVGHELGLPDAHSFRVIDTTGVEPNFGIVDPTDTLEWKTDPMSAVAHLPASNIRLSPLHNAMVQKLSSETFNVDAGILMYKYAGQTQITVVDQNHTPLKGVAVNVYCVRKAFEEKNCSSQVMFGGETFLCVPNHPSPVAMLSSNEYGSVKFTSPVPYTTDSVEDVRIDSCAVVAAKIEYKGHRENSIITGLDTAYAKIVDGKEIYERTIIMKFIDH